MRRPVLVVQGKRHFLPNNFFTAFLITILHEGGLSGPPKVITLFVNDPLWWWWQWTWPHQREREGKTWPPHPQPPWPRATVGEGKARGPTGALMLVNIHALHWLGILWFVLLMLNLSTRIMQNRLQEDLQKKHPNHSNQTYFRVCHGNRRDCSDGLPTLRYGALKSSKVQNIQLIEFNFQEQTCRRTTGRPILFICIFYANPTKKDLKTSFEAWSMEERW